MAVVKFEKNGQGFYDFDALLNVTSVDFVSRISSKIEFYEKHDVNLRIKLDVNKAVPTVYMYEQDSVHIFRFYGKGVTEEMTLTRWDLQEMMGDFNG